MEVPYFQLLEKNKQLRAENVRLNEVIRYHWKKFQPEYQDKVVFPALIPAPSSIKGPSSAQVKTLFPQIRASPPLDATKVRRDEEQMAGDPGPINGCPCPSRPAGIPTKPSTVRRRVFKKQAQRFDQKPANGEENSISEEERRLMVREKALYDRESAKVEVYLRDKLKAVTRQLSHARAVHRGGEGIQRLVRKRAELESSLREIKVMRQQWDREYAAVKVPPAGGKTSTGWDLSTKDVDERPLPVHEVKRKEVEIRPGEGVQQVTRETNPSLVECDSCGRRFSSDRIETHARICAKVAKRSK